MTELNPGGYCMCGCGEKAPLAHATISRLRWVKGEPIRYISGHNARIRNPPPPPNPSGLCQCGCGKPTPLARTTNAKSGTVRGEPIRFVRGHNSRAQSAALFELFDKTEDGCWNWKGRLNPGGYAMFGDKLAHRLIYEKLRGPIPSNLEPDHLCRNRGCVNPYHLEVVTSALNTQRGLKAKLTADDVLAIRASSRPHVELAREYGVSAANICNIRARRSWKNV